MMSCSQKNIFKVLRPSIELTAFGTFQLRNYSADLNARSLTPVLAELPPLLSEVDLHIAQLTMNLLTTVAKLHKGSLAEVQSNSLPEIFRLSQSPLLQVSTPSWKG
jgi:hypothetical protein